MSSSPHERQWYVRVGRVGAGVLVMVSVLVWVRPVNVPSSSGGYFGCGSPADPRGAGDLVELVCGVELSAARVLTVALIAAAAVLLAISEVAVPRWPTHTWTVALLSVGVVAFPLITVGAASLFVRLGGSTPQGSPFSCGTALTPATDPVSGLVCGDIAQSRLVGGSGVVLLGLALIGAALYVAAVFGGESDPTPNQGGEANHES